jgi:hypothetical protein
MPILKTIEHQLVQVCDSSELPAIIHVAAIASLLVVGKYYTLSDENEVYQITIGEYRISLLFSPFLRLIIWY